MKYKETDPFYGSAPWRAARQQAMDRDHGYCVRCREAGRFTIDRYGQRWPVLATMVHHKKPRKECPELELVLENLESLCNNCHAEEHPEKGMGGKKEKVPTAAEQLGVMFEKL